MEPSVCGVRRAHLLLALVLLLQLALSARAGMFDFLDNKKDKAKHKAKDGHVASRLDEEAAEPVDEEAVRLAEMLNGMSKPSEAPLQMGASHAKDLTKLLEASHTRDRSTRPSRRPRRRPVFEDEDEEEREREKDSHEPPQPQPPAEHQTSPQPQQQPDGEPGSRAPVESSSGIPLPRLHIPGGRRPRPPSSGASSGASKLLSGAYLKKVMKDSYKTTKGFVKEAVVDIPKFVGQATDSISALLKLDSRGRLLSLIDSVKDDMHAVRSEYSSFSIAWSPLMERALNYLGAENLNKVKHNPKDELDFRQDALVMLTFGYEFMHFMTVWREHMLVAHAAYKYYLEQLKQQLADPQAAPVVDEEYMYELGAVHNYLLFVTWMEVDLLALESRKKLEHLSYLSDEQEKDYEREYFRQTLYLQEIYEPTEEEFKRQKEQIRNELSQFGNMQIFEEVDQFYNSFKNHLASGTVKGVNWEVPREMNEFLARMREQLQYNTKVYDKAFLTELARLKAKGVKALDEDQ